MDPRQACLDCLAQEPPALFEAALWIAAEHLPAYLARPRPARARRTRPADRRQPGRPRLGQRARPGVAAANERTGFLRGRRLPLQPRFGPAPAGAAAAPGTAVVAGAGGHGTGAAAGHSAGRSELPDASCCACRRPTICSTRPPDGASIPPTAANCCCSLQGPKSELQAAYLKQASPGEILQRLSRNLRQLHSAAGEPLAALKDAQRVIELGPVGAADHEARAGLYRQLDCPQAERYDLERALLLSDDPTEQLRLGQRLGELAPPTGRALH